jgi:hypothetical protein
MGSFSKKYKSSQKILVTFFDCKSSVLILTKMGWATYWAIFLQQQTHLVTLVVSENLGHPKINRKVCNDQA